MVIKFKIFVQRILIHTSNFLITNNHPIIPHSACNNEDVCFLSLEFLINYDQIVGPRQKGTATVTFSSYLYKQNPFPGKQKMKHDLWKVLSAVLMYITLFSACAPNL